MKTLFRYLFDCAGFAVTIFVLLLLLASCGCNDPMFYDKPSDRACMKAITGQKLVLEKGVISDTTWTIKANEFTAFSIERIAKNSDGTATASVKFELTSGSKVLRVEGEFVYRFHKKDQYVEFLSFTPTRLLKLGIW